MEKIIGFITAPFKWAIGLSFKILWKLSLASFFIAVLALFIVPHMIGWEKAGAYITPIVKNKTGLDVLVDGKFNFSIVPTKFSATNVRLYNPETKRNELKAALVDANLYFWPLLGGKFKVKSITIVNSTLHIIRDEKGRLNWAFTEDIPGMPSQNAGSFEVVQVQNGKVIYEDKQKGDLVALDNVNATLTSTTLDGPFSLQGSFVHKGYPISGQFNVGQLLTGKETPLSAVFQVPTLGANVQLTGSTIKNLRTGERESKLKTKLYVASVESVLHYFEKKKGKEDEDIELPLVFKNDVNIEGQTVIKKGNIFLKKVNASFGKIAKAKLEIKIENNDILHIEEAKIDLAEDTEVNIVGNMPLRSKEDDVGSGFRGKIFLKGDKIWDTLDAFMLPKLLPKSLEFESNIALEAGEVKFSDFAAIADGGKVFGNIDWKRGDIPTIKSKLELQKLDLTSLPKAPGEKKRTARLKDKLSPLKKVNLNLDLTIEEVEKDDALLKDVTVKIDLLKGDLDSSFTVGSFDGKKHEAALSIKTSGSKINGTAKYESFLRGNALNMRAKYDIIGDTLMVKDLVGDLAAQEFSATGEINLSKDIPLIKLAVKGSEFRLYELFGQKSVSRRASREWSKDPIDLTILKKYDLKLATNIDRLKYKDQLLGNFVGTLTTSKGNIDPLTFKASYAKGHTEGSLKLLSGGNWSLLAGWEGSDLVDIFKGTGFAGASTLSLDVNSTGESLHEVMKNMRGQGIFEAQNGKIGGFSMDLVSSTVDVLETKAQVTEVMTAAFKTADVGSPFKSLSFPFVIKNGVMKNTDPLKIEAVDMQLKDDGLFFLNLSQKHLDLRGKFGLTKSPKLPTVSMRLSGDLEKPEKDARIMKLENALKEKVWQMQNDKVAAENKRIEAENQRVREQNSMRVGTPADQGANPQGGYPRRQKQQAPSYGRY
ncbi:MAG: AsmA family protein [Alphaproteobacteria bacterium]